MKGFFVLDTAILCQTHCPASENWPRFRGNNGDGSAESKIPSKWEQKHYRWSLPLEENGHGSPSVWGERVFLNTSVEKGKTRKVICVNAQCGKIEWTRSILPKLIKLIALIVLHPAPPALNSERVFSVWGHTEELIVTAHSHKGKLIWKKILAV